MKQQKNNETPTAVDKQVKFTNVRYTTIFNVPFRTERGRNTTLPSVAIPDQSYSIKELLTRFKGGTMPPVAKRAAFDDNPNIDEISWPDFNRMDLTEIDDFDRKLKTRINDARTKLQQQQQQQQQQ